MRRRVVVVGAGVIGLASAFRCARRGDDVTVISDPERTPAAYWAGGMLAPVAEAWFGEEELLRMGLASAAAWPAFARDVEAASGRSVGLRADGTVLVAATEDDRGALDRLVGLHRHLRLPVEALTRRGLRELEPALAPGLRAGAFIAGDHSVDNRALLLALDRACAALGVHRRHERVTELSGLRAGYDAVVVAAGWGSAELVDVDVRPVKGQILRVRGAPLLTRTVRAYVDGAHVYLVPRADGEVVVGATSEEMGTDVRVTAGAVYDLLRDACAVVPGVKELEVVDFGAGLRPGSPRNEPTVARREGVIVATGHYRNGVLLAPWTADRVAELVAGPVAGPVAERTEVPS